MTVTQVMLTLAKHFTAWAVVIMTTAFGFALGHAPIFIVEVCGATSFLLFTCGGICLFYWLMLRIRR